MEPYLPRRCKDKVVILMGATGTGKSRLSIDLAKRISAEIVNSDKIQVYKGLDTVTNKVTEEECCDVTHHLLDIVNDPDEDFTAMDFRYHASVAVESIIRRGKLPIIVGGSNSHIKALVIDDVEFQSKYECCFLWVDVSMDILQSFVSKRVDQMVKAGLVEEVREYFNPNGNYSRGIRRAIGVSEMDEFFRNESIVDDDTKFRILEAAIDQIKSNTCMLAERQIQNIRRLENQFGWDMHYLDATEAFLKCGIESDQAWERFVVGPSTMIVNQFLYESNHLVSTPTSIITGTTTVTAVVAGTH